MSRHYASFFPPADTLLPVPGEFDFPPPEKELVTFLEEDQADTPWRFILAHDRFYTLMPFRNGDGNLGVFTHVAGFKDGSVPKNGGAHFIYPVLIEFPPSDSSEPDYQAMAKQIERALPLVLGNIMQHVNVPLLTTGGIKKPTAAMTRQIELGEEDLARMDGMAKAIALLNRPSQPTLAVDAAHAYFPSRGEEQAPSGQAPAL